MRLSVAASALGLLFGTAGCRCDPKPQTTPVDAAPAPLTPLSEPSWLVPLKVAGHRDAQLAVPLGSMDPRPLVIALHGASDRAEWQCGTWAGITRGQTFVLCPAGVPAAAPGRDTFRSPEATTAEVRAGLEATKARFGRRIAPGGVVLAGYGIGAVHARELQRQEPAFFATLVLLEGAAEGWNPTVAGAFVKRGGRRVLLGCASDACKDATERARLFSARAGADARAFVHPEDQGLLGPKSRKTLAESWTWLATGK